ncbi:MAG TPA: hypothetical protein VMI54_09580 [Polyangiaceae bacterium]|nr:hypothetical protein [Polyangiaceae bacterium]
MATLVIVFACSTPSYNFVKNNDLGHCSNGVLDADTGETDVDCGGPDCHGCTLGGQCNVQSDCSEGQCLAGYCQTPGCSNGVQDGQETAVDCGGTCPGCATGQPCNVDGDCASGVCPDGHCASATCNDMVRNGQELGIDCGGPKCDGCPIDSPCNVDGDCLSGACDPTTHKCVLSCLPGTADCNGDPSDGCETNTLTDTRSCGTCGHQCDLPNADSLCVGGQCQIDKCRGAFDRCSTDQGDGCQTNTDNDVSNCGGCGIECAAVNGTPSCVSGNCQIDCAADFGDCDGDPSNGCEASTKDVDNCGSCGNKCPAPGGKTPNCVKGKCGTSVCDTGLGDCNGNGTCEFDITSDPMNCGRCGRVCSALHGNADCENGECVITSCDDGFANCDSDASDGGYANGCEADLSSNSDNCGGCGKACSFKHGMGACQTSSCTVTSCDAGFFDCDMDASNGCEAEISSDPTNCGGCNHVCTAQNATPTCTDSQCGAVCTAPFDHCVSGASGCETDTSSNTQHCGDCTTVCSQAGATSASCKNSQCQPPTCDSSHLNCDASKSGGNANGCETDITQPANCGACGNVCPSSAPACVSVGGAYRCQATVTHVNDVNGSATGTTLSIAHTLGAGTNRLLLAAIVMESTNTSGLAGARPASVLYGSVAMTASGSQTSDTGAAAYDNPYVYYYYLTEPDLPASGQTLKITGTANKVDMVAAELVEFAGVDPTNPIILGTGKALANSGGSCAATGPVTTTLPGTTLFVLSAAHYAGTATVTGAQLVNPPLWNPGQIGANQVRAYATYGGTDATVIAPGTYTIGFTYQWCNPAGVLPIGVVPYRQP